MTVDLLDESREGSQKLYAQYLTQARDLEATLRGAETLQQQVAAGQTEGLANSLAVLLLRARAIGDAPLPIDLTFDGPAALAQGADVTSGDLDTLISILRQRRDAIMEQSRQLAQSIDEGKAADVGLTQAQRDIYVKRLSELNQQYEQQTAQLKLLQQRRNVAMDLLSILQRKLDEQRVALGAPEVQVRFISTDVAPPRSTLSRAILYTAAAAITGLCLSICIVLGLAVVRPRLRSRQSQPRGERPLDQPTTS
jgi:hypothetical protein